MSNVMRNLKMYARTQVSDRRPLLKATCFKTGL